MKATGLRPAGLTGDRASPWNTRSGWQDSNLRVSCSQGRRGGQTPLHPVEPPERVKLPTSWFEARRSDSLSYEGSERDDRYTDGQIRTDTDQGLSLAPLPVGLRRREGGVGGSRTLASDRARIAGCPQRNPVEPTEEESNLRLPGFNRALVPSQLSVERRPVRESNPPLRRCRPPDGPLSHLVTKRIGEKESNLHFPVQGEVACRLADPRANHWSPSRSTAPVTFQPSALRPGGTVSSHADR